ncbi:MAG: cache domain-containing protein [Methanoculleus sp.]|nr:cache domain-containing protein [Methanoculleus sp.]
MRMYAVFVIVALVLAAVLGAGCTDTKSTPPENQSGATPTATSAPIAGSPASPEELVAFVEIAYEYAHVHGQEAALSEFNNQTGRFIEGELYIFAYDSNGTTLALPFQPEVLGKSRWNITDTNGTAYIQDAVATAQSGGGFIRYLYEDPADNFTVKQKLSYVMMVDQGWLIGAGIYDPEEDPLIMTGGADPRVRENLKSLVGEAITYARTEGTEEALREFNDQNGTFVHDSLYIYAFDYNGTTLALPHQPQLIGTDLSGLQDPFGVNYTRIEILLAQHGGGFIFYHYPNPSHDMTLEPKMSYVQKVDDAWWLGAGVYLSEAAEADAPARVPVSG